MVWIAPGRTGGTLLFVGSSSFGNNRHHRGIPAFPFSRVPNTPSSSRLFDATIINPTAAQLKDDLIAIAAATNRGFSASRNDRETIRKIVKDLSKYSPTDQPAAAYYSENKDNDTFDGSTLAGKWTLVYTDAPDITSLDAGPFSTAKLGKIGQECDPPYIKNVIEWKKPDWALSLPFSGGESSRILQKVCCEARCSAENPKFVDLELVGLELCGSTAGGEEGDPVNEGGLGELGAMFFNGPAGLLEGNPVNLRGPLKAPFGRFEVLFLDDDMRITKTNQGFIAVNSRNEKEWF